MLTPKQYSRLKINTKWKEAHLTKTQVKYTVWCIHLPIWLPHFLHKQRQSIIQFIHRTCHKICIKQLGLLPPSTSLQLGVFLQHPVFVGIDAVCVFEDVVGIWRWCWRCSRLGVDWLRCSFWCGLEVDNTGMITQGRGGGIVYIHNTSADDRILYQLLPNFHTEVCAGVCEFPIMHAYRLNHIDLVYFNCTTVRKQHRKIHTSLSSAPRSEGRRI